LYKRGANRAGQTTHDDADRRLRHSQPFRRPSDVLLLEDGHGDGEVRTDQTKPFNILIKHIKKFIGLINTWCANLEP
jgi:hypothetical protein